MCVCVKVWSLEQCSAAVEKAESIAADMPIDDDSDNLPAIGTQAMGKFRRSQSKP